MSQALAGSLRVAFAQVFTDDRIASGGKHGADGDGQCDDREDDVERRQGVAPHEPGDKDSVYDGVQRHERHHDDGRRCEFQ